jgi:predicted component of type VI protein secretion system
MTGTLLHQPEPIEVEAEVTSIVPQEQPKPRLEVFKPDVIVEAISVELKLIQKLEQDITNLASKIADKKRAIKKCREIIKTLEKAKKLKES